MKKTKLFFVFLLLISALHFVSAVTDIYITGNLNLPVDCRTVVSPYVLELQQDGSTLTGTLNAQAYMCRVNGEVCNRGTCIQENSGCRLSCKDTSGLLEQKSEIISGPVTGSISNNIVTLRANTNMGQFIITGTLNQDPNTGKVSFSGNLDSSTTCEPGVYVKGSVSGKGIMRERKPIQSSTKSNIFLSGNFNIPSECNSVVSTYYLELSESNSNVSGTLYGVTWICKVKSICRIFKCTSDCRTLCTGDDQSVRDSLIDKSSVVISGPVTGSISNNIVTLRANTNMGQFIITGTLNQDPNTGKVSFSGNLDSSTTCEPGVYVKGSVSGKGIRNEQVKTAKLGESCNAEITCEEGECIDGICSIPPKCDTGTTQCGSSCCMLSQSCDPATNTCKPSFCNPSLTQCGFACVNTSSDNLNCGACGNKCAGGLFCINGVCSETYLFNPDRCGEAGIKCGENEICSEGKCVPCKENESVCNNECINLNTDSNNCGSCGNSCGYGKYCSEGQCVSSPSCVFNSIQYIQCGRECCSFTQWCNIEIMKCEPISPSNNGTLTQCGNSVVDINSDPNNCGSCFNSCSPGEECIQGTCIKPEICGNGVCGTNESCSTCPSDCGQCIETGCSEEYPTLCGDKCINTLNDTQNCGSCGNACSPDQVCSNGTCKGVLNSKCQTDSDCIDGYCVNSSCQLVNCKADSDCGSDQYCNLALGICDGGCRISPDNCNDLIGSGTCDSSTRECKSLSCPSGLVLINESCYRLTPNNCTQDSECSSGTCYNSLCVSNDSPVSPTPSYTPVGKPTFGSSTSGGKPTPKLIAVEENKAASDIFYSLFQTSKTRLLSYDKCIRGSICSSSDDCCGAPCLNSRCACSISACTTTADCCSGYCENGKCNQEPRQRFSLFSSLTSPNLGCAGLVEECSPGEKTCISLCNGLSLLLVLVAGSFGTLAWSRFRHPVAGLIAAFIPIVIGLALYPFLGIVSGIILLSLLVYKDTGSIEV